MSAKSISVDFPFQSIFLEVHGSKMHYIDEGEGDPILFLHGNPTSNYLWRNVIPYLTPHARCIAPDLIGLGKSDKPDIPYHFFDHSKYLEGFIKKLGLTNVTLVLHDWGSGLGFHYGMRHEPNLKGIAFMESMMKPLNWEDLSASNRLGFTLFRAPGVGWFLTSILNVFVNQFMPQGISRKLSKAEMDVYKAPFRTIRSRRPLVQFPRMVPLGGQPEDLFEVISTYSQKLQQSDLPKILFHADPGALIGPKDVEWAQKHIKNLETVDIGTGIHFVQEDNPHKIGEELARWYQSIQKASS
ncbi:MAG: haloalkane dehalogenase [Chloroflexota bacterium]